MSAFRFVHTSDLHLGRRFANVPQPPDGNIRGRLMEARHGAIGRIAAVAREAGAAHVLLAGDTFDTATPSPGVVRQAVAAMGGAAGLHWWLLPGNHDNLRDAEPLWEGIVRDAPANVHPVLEAAPLDLAPGVALLPAPVAYRSTGVDATEAMPRMETGEGVLRIGLAHGGIVDFTEGGDSIPPDRDRSARLDYLGLGDWHGRMEVSPRVHYSGTPEQDRFKHDRRGVCLAVTLDGPGAVPRVDEIETGAFLWTRRDLPLGEGQDVAAALDACLPGEGRRDILLQLRATGRASLPAQAALRHAAGHVGPEFAHFALDTDGLQTSYDKADLDEIDRAGALRQAAEALRDESFSEALAAPKREIAGAALARLYAYLKEETP